MARLEDPRAGTFIGGLAPEGAAKTAGRERGGRARTRDLLDIVEVRHARKSIPITRQIPVQ